MSSGFGLDGGRGRCFHFWQEFNKCYASADLPQQCLAQRDDSLLPFDMSMDLLYFDLMTFYWCYSTKGGS
ncbi:Putative NADH dehydrogenase (Ubiquinone) Fe-S protein 5 [Rhizopus microsporus]|nr:Putative NADH dehydrogenase (Ubiquinone) Fe-S protein 5 [Rhizopus microsporus]